MRNIWLLQLQLRSGVSVNLLMVCSSRKTDIKFCECKKLWPYFTTIQPYFGSLTNWKNYSATALLNYIIGLSGLFLPN